MGLKITDTTLRDGHQSLYATRMKLEDMIPILETIDSVGYHSLEMWGGATFDSCMRFLNEDPWVRLKEIRKRVKNTKLQMLLRGQNILGYKNYPDDVLEEFIKKTIYNGMDIIRIFDALNDPRNMQKAVEVTKKEGGHAQVTICYTISPVHNVDLFSKMAEEFVDMGADSICIKDMAGLVSPYDVEKLIKNMKKKIKVPIQLHSHCTSGMATTSYFKAAEAGIDIVDTAISPFALGTSQPPIETLATMLEGTEYDTGLNKDALMEKTEYFKKMKEKYSKFSKMNITVDTNVLSYQIPGGMISNLASQLDEANAIDKFDECLKEVPRVREELGFPPLVTPTSQIVGSQAVMNVLTGERYKMIIGEVKNYILGYYGKAPYKIDEELKTKVLKDKKPITGRPADLLEPMLDKAKKEVARFYQSEEDILSYCLFPQVALEFFKNREAGKVKLDYNIVDEMEKDDADNPYYPS